MIPESHLLQLARNENEGAPEGSCWGEAARNALDDAPHRWMSGSRRPRKTLFLLGKLARPERFERPTLRFVVAPSPSDTSRRTYEILR
jgi:hypothetical protein